MQLNSTARSEEALQFTDITRSRVTHPRIWALEHPECRIELVPALRKLIEAFGSSLGGLSLAQLRCRVRVSTSPNTDPLAAAVDRLLDLGIVVPPLWHSEQSDLLAEAIAFLSGLGTASASDMATMLGDLETAIERLADHEWIDPAYFAEVRRVAAAIEAVSGDTGARPVIFEDCFFAGDEVAVEAVDLDTAADDAGALMRLFTILDFSHVVQHLLAARYAATASDVPWEEQLAAVATRVAQTVNELFERPLSDHAEHPDIAGTSAAELVRAKSAFLSRLCDRLASGEDIVLADADITDSIQTVPTSTACRNTSYVFLSQRAELRDGTYWAVNRIYTGHSTLMSRFMLGQPDERLEEVRQYLRTLTRNGRLVELSPSFGFNANLHPSLANEELQLSAARIGRGDVAAVSADELVLVRDAATDRLYLAGHDGRLVDILYAGFLTPAILPPLVQVLARLHVQGLVLELWQDLLYSGLLGDASEIYLPRVTYRSLLLSRRTWIVALELLPTEVSDADFMTRFVALADRLGIPDRFFARLVPPVQGTDPPADDAILPELKHLKPIYVDINAPLLIRLLRRSLGRDGRYIVFQEAAPAPGHDGIEAGGERHICEFQFEVARCH